MNVREKVVALACSVIVAQLPGLVLAQNAADADQNKTTGEPQSIPTPPPPQVSETRQEPGAAKGSDPLAIVNPARSARARGEREWAFRILEAYPAKAKREGIEGTIALALVVTPNGRPSDCKVTKSSGHTILDDAACNGMLRYARFDPALDKDGKPTSGVFTTRITYRNQ